VSPDARFAIGPGQIEIERLASGVEADARFGGEGCGAVCTFVGVVRATHRGRRVRYLTYEAFEPLALKVFERIGGEAARQWPGAVLAIHHRVGRLEIGEASVAIAAAAAHRAESFAACRYAIERVKQVAPIWKHEFFEDGEAWVEGAVADPDDETMRQAALERACA
jgi:molybdopterin synthase catalytic subunit